LSRQLRQLERELGIELFRRGNGRLTLSSAGERLLPTVRELLLRAEQVPAAAQALTSGSVSVLRVAAPAATISDVIAPYLAQGNPADPLIDVREETSASALDALARGVDVVVMSGAPSNNYQWQAITRLPLFAYPPPGHPWCTERVITIDALVKETLAVLTPRHGTRRMLDEAVAESGVGYHATIECESPLVAQAIAAAGRAVAVVSDDSRFDLRPLLLEAPAGILRIPLHAAWLPGHFADETIRAFLARLTDYCAERYGSQTRPPGHPVGAAASSNR
jgi:DNA-binding transcriptional LysR family regulator